MIMHEESLEKNRKKLGKRTLKQQMRRELFVGRNMGVVVDDRTKNKLYEQCKLLEREVRRIEGRKRLRDSSVAVSGIKNKKGIC